MSRHHESEQVRGLGPVKMRRLVPRLPGLDTLGLLMLGVVIGGCGIPAEGGRLGELRGSVMVEPIPKPDLTLTDTNGEPYDLRAETDGYLTLVFFGYTNCPDVCPVHMANLGAVYRELLPEVRDHMRVVFVSTDPERDTPARLRSWLDSFHPSFVGLRGSIDDINAALASMMLPGVAVMPAEHGQEPMIGHPAAVLAFSADGLARVRYPFGVRQSDWLHDLPILAQGS
ncbi:MAG: SCO family protein [Chloroflexi bacterium]|nr:SCO family protein [Chloroflexota bacterium]